jgi:ComF family protein
LSHTNLNQGPSWESGRALVLGPDVMLSSLRTILGLFFPDRCVGCSKIGTLLCPDCLTKIKNLPSPICPACLKPNNVWRPHPGCRGQGGPDFLFTPFVYRGVMRNLIKRAKFKKDKRLVSILATLLIEEVEESEDVYSFLHELRPVVVPVPLSLKQLKARGFNQAAILAWRLAQRFGLTFLEEMLIKSRDTLPQSGLTRSDRAQNVISTFVTPEGLLGDRQKVLLVDDVLTTGATLRACTLSLRQRGANEVWAIVLAH